MSETTASSADESGRGRAGEVFLVALKLGLTSFGGPIAHLGYFERTYIRERQWLTPDEYGGLVALCQMVPGPASVGGSQLQLSSSITEGADYDRSRCPDRPAVAPMLRMPAIMSHCSAKTALTQSITLRTHAERRRSR